MILWNKICKVDSIRSQTVFITSNDNVLIIPLIIEQLIFWKTDSRFRMTSYWATRSQSYLTLICASTHHNSLLHRSFFLLYIEIHCITIEYTVQFTYHPGLMNFSNRSINTSSNRLLYVNALHKLPLLD